MKNKIFEINVDFEKKSAVDTDLIKIVKGDYNSIEFDLKMDKTDYKRAVLFLVKPSKKNFVVDIANSKAIFTEKNTFDEVGIYYYGIVLYGTNSKLTTSTKGKIQVVEGYNEDNEDITGDENYPILDKLIEEVTDLKDKINASLGVMNKTFKEVTYDPSTGVMSFKNLNNEVTNINLPLSLLISSASYDNDNKKIVLTLANNDTIDIPILDLVSNYYDDKINANKEYIASTSNELYRLKTDVLETGESSGNNIHLEDSAWSEMQEISVDGVCEQVVTTGANLCDLNVTQNNKVVYNSDGTITINGSGGFTLAFKQFTAKANTKYYMKWELLSGTVDTSKSNGNSFLNPLDNTNIKQDEFKKSVVENDKTINGFWINNQTVFTNAVIRIWVSETQSPFEPYTGNQPSPSPNYPQEIKTLTGDIKLTSCGKNIFNLANSEITSSGLTTTLINNIIKYSGTATNSYQNATLPREYKIFKGSYNLILSNVLDVGFQIRFQKTQNFMDGGFIVNIESGQTSKKFIITENYNYCYLILTMKNGNTYSGSAAISLVNDTGDTTYEPYQDSSLNITIPSNEFVAKLDDTYKDTLNVVYKSDGHYHLILNKVIGKIVLNGREKWEYTSDSKYFRVTDYTFEKIPLAMAADNKSQYSQISNYFKLNKNWSGINSFRDNLNVQGEFYPVQNVGYKLAFRNLNFDNVDDFKSWLPTHNTEVYYPFATPYEVDLGIVDQLLTFDEITNIFTDSDLYPVINIKYYRNFIKTIQNLQVNNDTLKNELVSIESRLTALENANTSVVDNNPSDEESEVTE